MQGGKSKKVKLNADGTGYDNPIVVVDLKDTNEANDADGFSTTVASSYNLP